MKERGIERKKARGNKERDENKRDEKERKRKKECPLTCTSSLETFLSRLIRVASYQNLGTTGFSRDFHIFIQIHAERERKRLSLHYSSLPSITRSLRPRDEEEEEEEKQVASTYCRSSPPCLENSSLLKNTLREIMMTLMA